MNRKHILILILAASLYGCQSLHTAVPPGNSPREFIGDLIPVRSLDKLLIHEKIEAGKEYLLRVMDPEKYGFYKKYDAANAKSEKRLRTIFSASSLYTLLKISDLDPDPRVTQAIPRIAGFLLSMQVKEGEQKGAFYYSYYLETGEKQQAFVVGTAAKTIFTLLELYRRTGNESYFDSAKAAGEWLLAMRNADGSVINHVKFSGGKRVHGKKFSCLYTGQVLSAFSRLYRVTGDERYYNAAVILARNFIKKAQADFYFAKDEYRLPDDPIPTSWMAMSLLDFYRIKQDLLAKETLVKLADALLKRQMKNPDDILAYGRFEGTEATSGNGWISEVLTEFYKTCKEENWTGCEEFKKAILLDIRWLIQNTYSKENSTFLKQPEKAIGGLIRNSKEESVRTDAVCHGLNSYINIYGDLGGGELI